MGRTSERQVWFRWYHEATHDMKLRTLTPAQRWLWVAVLTAASESPIRGFLLVSEKRPMTDAHLADLANVSVKVVAQTMPVFHETGMIQWDKELGCWYVGRWDERQHEHQSSTERVRKHRAKKQMERFNGVTDPRNETPPESESQSKSDLAVVGTEHSRRLHVVRDDDEDSGAEAVQLLAELALERREAQKGPVENKSAWLAKATAERAERYAADIRDALGKFTWRPEDLARHLEPEAFPTVAMRPETYVAKCQTCNDRPNAYDIDEHGNAVPCPACSTKETA